MDHPLWILSPQIPTPTSINPLVIIIFHTSIKDTVHIYHSFGCCSPHLSLFSTSPLHSSVMDIYFWTWPPKLRPLFIPCLRIVACRPPDPICVVCSQTGAARAKCQAPSCCLHLPQWPAQCPSLCPTLNPTARPLMADSPRPHLCVSDPLAETNLKTKPQQKRNNNKTKSENPHSVQWKHPCHCSFSNFAPLFSCVSNIHFSGYWNKCKTYCGAYYTTKGLVRQTAFSGLLWNSSGIDTWPHEFVWLHMLSPSCVVWCGSWITQPSSSLSKSSLLCLLVSKKHAFNHESIISYEKLKFRAVVLNGFLNIPLEIGTLF